MRQELDTVLQRKVAYPAMELYTPHSPAPSSTSQLIQAIIDLITTEDYTGQVRKMTNSLQLNSQKFSPRLIMQALCNCGMIIWR